MLDVFFADDARQKNPTRERMGSIVGTGCIHVPGPAVGSLETGLADLCADTGFPEGTEGEFKWSPGPELWMRANLIADDRTDFFHAALDLAAEHDITVTIVANDSSRRPAMKDSANHEIDVTRLLLERVQWCLEHVDRSGLVVVDRPTGDRKDETHFLQSCLETLNDGTAYKNFNRVAINVLSTPSSLVRCLQLADLVTSCSIAYISGERKWAPPLFNTKIRPLLVNRGRVAGIGFKLHPAFCFENLYHWMLGTTYVGPFEPALPKPDRPYSTGPDTW